MHPSSASRFPQPSMRGTKSSEEPTLRGPFDKSHISVRVITHSFVSSTDLTRGPQLPLPKALCSPSHRTCGLVDVSRAQSPVAKPQQMSGAVTRLFAAPFPKSGPCRAASEVKARCWGAAGALEAACPLPTLLFPCLQMRSTRKVSVWPVAFVGGLRYESPKVNAAGKVYGWKTVFDPHRPFAIDMAGFAVNLRLILQRSQAYFKLRGVKGGYQESSLLRELVTLNDLEPKAANCTKVRRPSHGGGARVWWWDKRLFSRLSSVS